MANLQSYSDDFILGSLSVKSQKNQLHRFSPTLWTSLFFLLLVQRSSGEDSVPTKVMGILGGSVILSLNISVDTEIENVIWTGPQKALALANAGGEITILDKHTYQTQLNISSENYSLRISNLTMKNAGCYKAQINVKNSDVPTEQKFTLNIYEQLQKPNVTVTATTSESAFCNFTLVCSVKTAGESVHYRWMQKVFNVSESYEDSTLTASWMFCDPDLVYTCTVTNPVSQSSSHSMHAQQFCTDPSASREETRRKEVIGILGESVILEAPASQNVTKVVWMFNTSVISEKWGETKIADSFTKSKEPNKDRVWVSSQDHSLKITQLEMEDAGHYSVYVCSEITSTNHFSLSIHRRLKKPKVTWIPRPPEDGTCRFTLICSVEESENNMVYRWTFLQKEAFMSQEGSFPNISWKSSENYPNFSCIATNSVNSSSWQFLFGNICPGPERSKNNWIILSLLISGLLFFGIFCSCFFILKRKRQCSTLTFSSRQAEDPVGTAGFKLKTAPKCARPTSDSNSDSSSTSEEEEKRTEMQQPNSRRDVVYHLTTQEDTASKGQAEYDSDNTVPRFVDEGTTVYSQVPSNLQGKMPAPQKRDSLLTVYCTVQRSKLVEPPPQKNAESSEISDYENFS